MTSWQTFRNEDGEDDEFDGETGDDYTQPFQEGRDCLLCLIDASPPMHVKIAQSDSKTPFQSILSTCIDILMQKIINSESDFVGIVFYGTVNIDSYPAVLSFFR
jgi:hypothetical protein